MLSQSFVTAWSRILLLLIIVFLSKAHEGKAHAQEANREAHDDDLGVQARLNGLSRLALRLSEEDCLSDPYGAIQNYTEWLEELAW
eukprot:CAMPEP_0114535584 /NCGR_PEP_ID=MMETSP0109-20121206/28506_1 /TAXON_ID=29199 /ORGANISM="Chlorarachnion reptans, Strain CCCM449" /LENGTH=85 /DNA_ID=CAMNT_0001719183 /DNA_START=280 /DNA_END=534 /DNA_ORIENTATION=-